MKVAVFGNDTRRVIEKIKNEFEVEPIVCETSGDHPIIGFAKETYGHNDEDVVIYDGCALQFVKESLDDDVFEVYEQIALASIANLDMVICMTNEMTDDDISFYQGYERMFPSKIKMIVNENEIIFER